MRMTLEERERRAYANSLFGQVELLAIALDDDDGVEALSSALLALQP